jgi:hypothetical protein
MRVLRSGDAVRFAQDLQTIRDAFGRANPISNTLAYTPPPLRADGRSDLQPSPTRTATVILGKGARSDWSWSQDADISIVQAQLEI